MKFPYIPIKHLIADVRSELKRMNQAGELNEEDLINDAIECIREIGGANYNIDQSSVIFIDNHKACLPSDLYLITDIWLCHAEPCMEQIACSTIWFTKENHHYQGSRILFPGDGTTGRYFCANKHYPTPLPTEATYIVQHPNIIRCSLPKAVLGVLYMGLPKEDGTGSYLMQDEVNSIKAVKGFMLLKQLKEKWIMGEVQNYIYQDLKQDYEASLDQAQAVMKFDNPADMVAKGYKQDHKYDRFKLK